MSVLINASRNASRTGLILLVFALVGTAGLAWTFGLAHPAIEASEKRERLLLLNQVMPPGLYDNDLIGSQRQIPASDLLGTRMPSAVWIARKGGQITGLVLEATAPDGYSGDIALLIGLNTEGEILGVRVTAHHETPGLGDYIDIAKSDWIREFDGHSLARPEPKQWKVRKDGGAFDSVAGATITPRAVVKAVKSALEYVSAHRAELLGGPSSPNQEPTS